MAEKPTMYVLPTAKFDALVARLNEPARDDPRLRKLMARPNRFTPAPAHEQE